MSEPLAPAGTDQSLRGALLLVAAAFAFTLEIVIMRYTSPAVDQSDVVLFRAGGQLVFALAWLMATRGPAGLRTNRLGLHLARGLVSLCGWGFYYASFARLDLALATVLTFTTSLFVVALAGPVMGERVGGVRLAATLVGFLGVVVASGLGTVGFEPAVLLGLAASLAGAAIVLLNRTLSASEPTPTIMTYIGIVTFAGALPVALMDWSVPVGRDLGLLVLVGATGTLGMWLTIEAYRVGEVSALAPIPYTRLVFATLAGVLLFGETPAPVFWLGAALIVASAVLVHARRPRPRSRQEIP
ncbi:DMT family transporter [Salinarimonas ramus]|uniref:Multidrug transporter n=1 Tax=Salinarimonas ramus TaxID=690164 RepID=A0A917QC03_9HYPH|nr:DMT family transporter [Salinarimonas ramus]GGK42232.1 multidrug transporter [Salinarimonas ramus]